MKITLLNGNSDSGNRAWEDYLSGLERILGAQGHAVTLLDLRALDLRACIGCFGCWVKTPGECITPDEGRLARAAVIQADFVLWAAPLRMGYPDALLKKCMDKSIPLIHPYFSVDHGEAHHRRRYARYPVFGLLLQKEAGTDERDLRIVSDQFRRTALNLKSYLAFTRTADQPVEDLASAICAGEREWRGLPAYPTATEGVQVEAPLRLTVFNGSPRGRKGNTPLLLEKVLEGFTSGGEGRSFEMLDLNRTRAAERFPRAFEAAECVLLGFPLYTDAMPSIVKSFIEQLEPFCGRSANPPIGFLVQSGFPEARHSRFVERYLERLALGLGSPYLGTIVRGGAEGVRLMPVEMNRDLFAWMRGLGAGFAQTGRFEPGLLKKIAGREAYPFYLGPVFALLARTPQFTFYWDQQLKENGVYEQRFAQPYRD